MFSIPVISYYLIREFFATAARIAEMEPRLHSRVNASIRQMLAFGDSLQVEAAL